MSRLIDALKLALATAMLIAFGILAGSIAGTVAFAGEDRNMDDFERVPSTRWTKCLSTEELAAFLTLIDRTVSQGGQTIIVRADVGLVFWDYQRNKNIWCKRDDSPEL